VLLSTYGGRGDVEPLVGLAVQLRALGTEVRVCAPPDWAERLAQFGVPLVPIGPPVRPLVHGAAPPSAADAPRLAAELIAEQFSKLPAVAEGCDALVATGLFPVAASAQSVAEKLGIRFVFAAYCPIVLPARHRRRALVARGWAGLASIDDAGDCFTVGEVNQQALFGRVAAVVHHGGAGTTTAAARAGAPQVVIPQMADQPYWAGRVADLGIGAAHNGPTPTTGSLSAALSTALTPQTRARAAAVAGTIRPDGATVAATLLTGAISRTVAARS
jgi:UDP:flavonoid glycosyltransferase YjiC (YdhE family)